MTDLEDRLRRQLRAQVGQTDPNGVERLDQVRGRTAAHSRHRSVALAAAAVVMIGVVGATAAGAFTSDGDQPVVAAGDPSGRPDSVMGAVRDLLRGMTVPADQFEAERLRPLGELASTDRVAALEGATEAVACAWASQYALGPQSEYRSLAVDMLRISDTWPTTTKLRGKSEYPTRVQSVGDELWRGNFLRPDWRTFLNCNTFPGDSNLASGFAEAGPAPKPGGSLAAAGTNQVAERAVAALGQAGAGEVSTTPGYEQEVNTAVEGVWRGRPFRAFVAPTRVSVERELVPDGQRVVSGREVEVVRTQDGATRYLRFTLGGDTWLVSSGRSGTTEADLQRTDLLVAALFE